jgi:hypothetical protein
VSDQDAKNSELVEIVKRNGDFRKNWGPIIGAFLYLRSIAAARGGSSWCKGLLVVALGAATLLQRHGTFL